MYQQPRGGGGGSGRGGGGPAGRGPGVKLMISNLDYGVSTDDVKVCILLMRPGNLCFFYREVV